LSRLLQERTAVLPLKRFIYPAAVAVFLFWPIGGLPVEQDESVRFAVATWNVRSGYGAAAAEPGMPFDMNTSNCTDPLRPRNAWGIGFPQQFLEAEIRNDPRVVALALQEAWGSCGNARNIGNLLQWPATSPERAGVALIARYGIVGPWDMWQLEIKNVGAAEDRWVIGGNVCVTPDCTSTAYMWSTHLAPLTDTEWPQHVDRLLDFLARKPLPHLFMGDLNIWQNDQWSPATSCGNPTGPMAEALDHIVRRGYVDAWGATQQGEGWTATVPRSGCGVDRAAGPYKRIDYIWSKGLQPVTTMRVGVVAPGAPSPSDHFGVKAQFVVSDDASVINAGAVQQP
jgi:hypothetical protein